MNPSDRHRGARPRVVIIGSGFGGLFAAKALAKANVDVTIIARTTHHLFQPLLYQVATGILAAGDIAPVTRDILARQRNVRVVLGLVEGIDLDNKTVTWCQHDLEETTPYDSLIVAAGAGQSYFGHDEFATFAPGMKTIDNALELRSRILGAFEQAEIAPPGNDIGPLLTFVVVGAGPTGVEMAGQIRELAATTLKTDFRAISSAQARVILVDAADRVLPPFSKRLSARTQRSLESLGVDVRLKTLVTGVDADGVDLRCSDGSTERIACQCKVWAAGVQGNPLGRTLAEQSGAELDRSGRIKVQPDLSLPNHPDVFVVGDLMAVDGVPGVAQGAIQSARHAAALIAARALPPGAARERALGKADQPFRYVDKGSMATIAKFSAVVQVGPLQVTGFPAWVMWLFLHLLYIAGFKQQISTLVRWATSFLSNQRSERVITNQQWVGRLALRQLGDHVSARLLRGEDIVPSRDRST